MRSPRGFHSALPAADQRVSREADHDRNERPSRGRKPHGEERRGEEAAGRVHAGNVHERDRDDVMQKRDAGLSAGAEIPAEREVHTGKNAVKDIPAHILPARCYHVRVRREQPHDRLRDKLREHADGDAEADGNAHGVAERFAGALRLARTDILRADSGDRGEHGRWDEENKAYHLLDDAHSGGIGQPAAVAMTVMTMNAIWISPS